MPKRNSKQNHKQNRDAEVIKITNMHRYYYNDYFAGLDINQKQGNPHGHQRKRLDHVAMTGPCHLKHNDNTPVLAVKPPTK